ncbi:MAG: TonB-dependent receptor plug domain-containing protein, partial [Cephaloticoccus sp.]|nr:TonB-dependent receptor plug domain-containing protein [Cephaloticoccus sp.]
MNKYPSKITRVIAACAALGAFATRGLGQETEDNKDEEKVSGEVIQLSPFTVQSEKDVGYFAAETTAGTRFRQALVDIPGGAAVITRELIDDLKASEVTKAVNFGVSGVTSLDNLQEDFSIRGFREIGNFRDGVASTAFFPTQTYDLDRIEVIKGPVALSFGNGTILGGAVNMVSRKPTPELKRDVDVTIGENSLVRATVNMSGPVTEAKDVRYRVTVGAQNDDRWKEIEYDNNMFVGGALDMDFGRSTVSFYAYRYETDSYRYFNDFLDISGYNDGVPDGYLRQNPLSTVEFSSSRSKDNFYDNLEYYFTSQIVTQLKDNLSFRAFYRYRDLQDRRGLVRGITVQPDNYTLARQYIPFAIDNRLHTIQTDVFYTVEFLKTKHDISFGADFSRGNNRQALVVITPAALDTRNPDYSSDDTLPKGSAIPGWSSNANNETEAISYYIQDYVSVLDGKLVFSAGMRWIDPLTISTNRVTNAVSR